MKLFSVWISIFLGSVSNASFAQTPRVLSECTVEYEISIDDTKANADILNTMKGATKTIYIKGNRSRSDLVSPTYTQTIINDSRSDTGIILTERGNSKFLIYLTEQKRKNQYKKFEGISFTQTGETKAILGYECVKAVAKLKDGSSYNIFYAPSIIPSTREYEYQFKDLPGFVLEYETESEDGKTRIKYSAIKITLTPVPASKFDAPKSGYRIL
jgi:GLPGLI family protein